MARCLQLKEREPSIPLTNDFPVTWFFHDYAEGRTLADSLSNIVSLKIIPSPQLPKGMSIGFSFHITVFDSLNYLRFLTHRFTARGGLVKRRKLSHIDNAFTACVGGADLVVNCTGAGSKEIGGIEDSTIEPINGHSVVVVAPWVTQASIFSYADANIDIVPRGRDGHVSITNRRLDRVP